MAPKTDVRAAMRATKARLDQSTKATSQNTPVRRAHVRLTKRTPTVDDVMETTTSISKVSKTEKTEKTEKKVAIPSPIDDLSDCDAEGDSLVEVKEIYQPIEQLQAEYVDTKPKWRFLQDAGIGYIPEYFSLKNSVSKKTGKVIKGALRAWEENGCNGFIFRLEGRLSDKIENRYIVIDNLSMATKLIRAPLGKGALTDTMRDVCMHEIIVTDDYKIRPEGESRIWHSKIVIDLDISGDAALNFGSDDFFTDFEAACEDTMTGVWDQWDNKNIAVYESNAVDGTKYSYHIVLNGCYVANHEEAKHHVQRIWSHERMKDHPTPDYGMYKPNHCIRCLNYSKLGEGRPKIVSEHYNRYKKAKGFLSLVTDPSATKFLAPQLEVTRKQSSMEDPTDDVIKAIEILKKHPNEFTEFEYDRISNGFIRLKCIGDRVTMCPICDRIHDSVIPFLMITKAGAVRLGCYQKSGGSIEIGRVRGSSHRETSNEITVEMIKEWQAQDEALAPVPEGYNSSDRWYNTNYRKRYVNKVVGVKEDLGEVERLMCRDLMRVVHIYYNTIFTKCYPGGDVKHLESSTTMFKSTSANETIQFPEVKQRNEKGKIVEDVVYKVVSIYFPLFDVRYKSLFIMDRHSWIPDIPGYDRPYRPFSKVGLISGTDFRVANMSSFPTGLSYLGENVDYECIQKTLWHAKNVICDGNLEHYNFLMWTMAHPLQTGLRSNVFTICLGKPGAGKSMFFGEFVKKIYGRELSHCGEDGTIDDNFNSQLIGKRVLYFDDLAMLNAQRMKKFKQICTHDTLRVRGMHVAEANVDNHINVFVCYNKMSDVKIDPEDGSARRVFAPRIRKMMPPKYFDELIREVKSPNWASTFFTYLLNLDIPRHKIPGNAIPSTDALREAMTVGGDPHICFIMNLAAGSIAIKQEYIVRVNRDKSYAITTASLYEMYVDMPVADERRTPKLDMGMFTKSIRGCTVYNELFLNGGDNRLGITPVVGDHTLPRSRVHFIPPTSEVRIIISDTDNALDSIPFSVWMDPEERTKAIAAMNESS